MSDRYNHCENQPERNRPLAPGTERGASPPPVVALSRDSSLGLVTSVSVSRAPMVPTDSSLLAACRRVPN